MPVASQDFISAEGRRKRESCYFPQCLSILACDMCFLRSEDVSQIKTTSLWNKERGILSYQGTIKSPEIGRWDSIFSVANNAVQQHRSVDGTQCYSCCLSSISHGVQSWQVISLLGVSMQTQLYRPDRCLHLHDEIVSVAITLLSV